MIDSEYGEGFSVGERVYYKIYPGVVLAEKINWLGNPVYLVEYERMTMDMGHGGRDVPYYTKKWVRHASLART